jgi:hypothetical protein
VGWFPLGPREVYRPSYPVSRGYFQNVNRSNTVINATVINKDYENVNVTNVVYANRGVRDAVVAVPRTVFVQSQPVSRAAIALPPEAARQAAVVTAAPVVPTARSVRGGAPEGGKPPARAFERPVVARTAPPSPPLAFEAQQRQLATRPGRPLDAATRDATRPAAPAPAPVVKVLPAAPPRRPAAPEPASPRTAAAPVTTSPGAEPTPAAPAAQAPRQSARPPAPDTAMPDARPRNERTAPGQADRPQRPARADERARPEPAASAASAARGRPERP